MKNKLSIFEAISIITIITISQIILDFPEYIIDLTGTGSIINLIFLSIITLIFCKIISNIFKSFPNSDIIDIAEFVGGNILKFIISLIAIAFLFLSIIIAISNFLYLLKTVYFSDFSILFILAFFIIPVVIANRKGFYSLKKISCIIFPILILSIVFLVFASTEDFNINNFFPILGYNIETTFKSGLQNTFIFNFILLYFFLMPLLNRKNDYKKVVFSSFFINFGLILITIISMLSYFPTVINKSLSSINSLNSIYLITRKIRITSYLTQSDVLFVLIWCFSIICYIGLASFAISYILNKLFHYESKSHLIFPTSSIIIGGCLLVDKFNFLTILEKYVFKYFSIGLIFVICFILLIIGYFKNKIISKSKKGISYAKTK